MPRGLGTERLLLSQTGQRVGTGWLPPMLDFRDYTEKATKLEPEIETLHKRAAKALKAPPSSVDLRTWCSPIENQLQLGSCTAHAALGIVEYFERRAKGKHIDGSRLFVYKTTRNLLQVTGDTGAWLRNTIGALALCGVPEERYWPYTDASPDFDKEPTQFVYSIADNFQALKYFAHDPLARPPARADVLASIKKYLVTGVPSMFGFFGYNSFESGDKPGSIPLPIPSELAGDPEWGHAIVAVGYDDAFKITNTVNNKTTTGALLIRNSWGSGWGVKGYGWMPYEYVLRGVALDFWSLLDMQYVDTDQFYLK